MLNHLDKNTIVFIAYRDEYNITSLNSLIMSPELGRVSLYETHVLFTINIKTEYKIIFSVK